MAVTNSRQKARLERRRGRVRGALARAAKGRPRLSVFRSSKQIYAQVIDDANGHTVATASSLEKDLRGTLKTGADIAAAVAVGKLVAERAKVLASVRSSLTAADISFMAGSRPWPMLHANPDLSFSAGNPI